jgi:CRISPR/Cas system-associated exonuclease Cas4 (RecB family)
MNRISFSKISTFISCPLKYKFQYVEQIPKDDTTSSQQLGKYIHEVLEHWREGLDITEVGVLFENKYLLADEEKLAVPKLLANAKEMYEPYRGLNCESEFRLEYKLCDNGQEIMVDGVVDKLYHMPDNKFIIVDYKTGKSRSDNSLQMKFYFYLLNKLRGYKVEDIASKIFYLRMKYQATYTFDEAEINEFETWLKTMIELIDKTGKFTHDFSRGCNYCPYRKEECLPYKIKQEKYGAY